jgi:hypothetical protein
VLALIKKIEHIYHMVAGATALQSEDRTSAVLEQAIRELVAALGDCTKFMFAFCKSSFLGRP